MSYCFEHGIPHSHFLGGPNRWTNEDQEKVMAFMKYKSHLCPECGTDPSEWLDGGGRRIIPPPFIAETIRCYGCVELKRDREISSKQDTKGGLHSRLVYNQEGVIP